MLNLRQLQKAIRDNRVDGWLLYDFRGSNILARRILGLEDSHPGSRRWVYFIPAEGEPTKLVHRIESAALDSLPGTKMIYLRWQEFESAISRLLWNCRRVAMEYSPRNNIPVLSRVDAGTVELVRANGVEVASSGNLVQTFEAVWDESQWEMHRQAGEHTDAAFQVAWDFIRAEIVKQGATTERAVQQAIMEHFDRNNLTTYSPPIVAVNAHSGDPHYETGSAPIRSGDFLLVDLWAKLKQPRSVYSDMTRVAFVGNAVPAKYQERFAIVAQARDAAIAKVRTAIEAGEDLPGWMVDDACRSVIEKAGFGEKFVHRTGHNIGQEVHGNGANIDNLETHEDRLLLPGTCFSIEPGIYDEDFGIRSEVNVFIDWNRKVHVTAGAIQQQVICCG